MASSVVHNFHGGLCKSIQTHQIITASRLERIKNLIYDHWKPLLDSLGLILTMEKANPQASEEEQNTCAETSCTL